MVSLHSISYFKISPDVKIVSVDSKTVADQ